MGCGVRFEWDPAKDAKLRRERAISFAEAQNAWADPDALEIEADTRGEPRWALIARLNGKVHTIILTRRADVIRLITVRRAHPDEERLYEETEQADE